MPKKTKTPSPTSATNYKETARLEMAAEFARCSNCEIDQEVIEKFQELFDATVGKAIEDYGVEWEEPIRSYALRHVCKIARMADTCEGTGTMSPADLQTAFDNVVARARKSCKSLKEKKVIAAGKIGVLCGE